MPAVMPDNAALAPPLVPVHSPPPGRLDIRSRRRGRSHHRGRRRRRRRRCHLRRLHGRAGSDQCNERGDKQRL